MKAGIRPVLAIDGQISEPDAPENVYNCTKFKIATHNNSSLRMKRVTYSLLTAIFFAGIVHSQAPILVSRDYIADGFNFDVDIANGKIYLI